MCRVLPPFLLCLLYSVACGPGSPTTPSELLKVAISTLAADGTASLGGLFPAVDVLATHCPTKPRFAEEITNRRLRFKNYFEDCPDIAWDEVENVVVAGGGPTQVVDGCGGAVQELAAIRAIVDTEDETFFVKIDNPIKVGDSLFLADGLVCEPVHRRCRTAVEKSLALLPRGEDISQEQADSVLIDSATRCGRMLAGRTGRSRGVIERWADCASQAETTQAVTECDAVAERGVVFPPPCARYFDVLSKCQSEVSPQVAKEIRTALERAYAIWNDIVDDVRLSEVCSAELAFAKRVIEECPTALSDLPQSVPNTVTADSEPSGDVAASPTAMILSAILEEFADLDRKAKYESEHRAARARGLAAGLLSNSRRPTPSAKVEVLVFIDMVTGFAPRAVNLLDQVERSFGDQVKVTYMHQPLDLRTGGRFAALALESARRQGRLQQMLHLLVGDQQGLPGNILRLAETSGIDIPQFIADMRSGELGDIIAFHEEVGDQCGAVGSPDFFVNGKEIRGLLPFADFAMAVRSEIDVANAVQRQGSEWLAERLAINNARLYRFMYEVHKPKPPPGPATALSQATVRLELPTTVPRLGPASPKIDIVLFSDYASQVGREAYATLRVVQERHQEDVAVRLVAIPEDGNAASNAAAVAAHCAATQGLLWEYADELFANQDDFSANALVRYVMRVGADRAKWRECMASPASGETVSLQMRVAAEVGVVRIPAIFINDRRLLLEVTTDTTALEAVVAGGLAGMEWRGGTTSISGPDVQFASDSAKSLDDAGAVEERPGIPNVAEDSTAPPPDAAARSDTGRGSRLNKLGLRARREGRHEEARRLYLQALRADPRNAWARYNLACELAVAGDVAGALTQLELLASMNAGEAAEALRAASRDPDFRVLYSHPRFQTLTRY